MLRLSGRGQARKDPLSPPRRWIVRYRRTGLAALRFPAPAFARAGRLLRRCDLFTGRCVPVRLLRRLFLGLSRQVFSAGFSAAFLSAFEPSAAPSLGAASARFLLLFLRRVGLGPVREVALAVLIGFEIRLVPAAALQAKYGCRHELLELRLAATGAFPQRLDR